MANKKRKKTGVGSYPADEEFESGPSGRGETRDVNTGAALGSNKMRKDKGELAAGQDKIQKDLDRYRDEMAEDAPASGSAEDNP